ncbi:hypothetical protein TNCV_4460751, partial [Trichonephila clavipes]
PSGAGLSIGACAQRRSARRDPEGPA